jgi:hypothetical protein
MVCEFERVGRYNRPASQERLVPGPLETEVEYLGCIPEQARRCVVYHSENG